MDRKGGDVRDEEALTGRKDVRALLCLLLSIIHEPREAVGRKEEKTLQLSVLLWQVNLPLYLLLYPFDYLSRSLLSILISQLSLLSCRFEFVRGNWELLHQTKKFPA